MGMHDIFPHFTKFLKNNLQAFEKKRFFVNENYHTQNLVMKEKHPVVLYELSLKQLREKLKKSH